MFRLSRAVLLAAGLVFLTGLSTAADTSSVPFPVSQLPAGAVARLGAVRLTHRQKAYDAAFSPDGKRLVSVGQDFTIRLWESSTGKPVRHFASNGKWWLVSVAYSPDGKHVAIGTTGRERSGDVLLWDVSSGKLTHTFQGHDGQVSVVAFAPDGKTLASSSFDGTVRLWDMAGKRERHVLRGHSAAVWAVAFSRDGRTLATAGRDGVIKLWDPANGRERATLRGHTGEVHMVAFSADGRKLASGSQDRTVKIWDVASGKAERTLEGHPGSVAALAFAPTGMLLAVGCERPDGRTTEIFGEIHLWDAAAGKRRAVLTGHRGYVNSVSFAPDGRTLASVGVDGTIRFWDVESGRERCSVKGHSQAVRSLAWDADGKTLVSASDDQTIQLWDVTAGPAAVKRQATLHGHYSAITAVAVAPAGHTLASSDEKGQVRIWDLPSGKLRYFLQRDSNKINNLDFAPDGKTLAASNGFLVRLWDITNAPHSGKEKKSFRADGETQWNAAFSPDGKILASAAGDFHVRLWDLATGKGEAIPKESRQLVQAISLRGMDDNPSNPVAFAADGRLLAVGRHDGSVRLLDLTTKTERAALRTRQRAIEAVLFTPDGKTLIAGSEDGTVTLWEVLTRKERAILEGHSGPVTSVALRADGRTLATGSEDTTILLWDLTRCVSPERQLPVKPTDAERQSLWNDLTGDNAARAYQTMCLLVQHPRPALALLRERLDSVKGPDAGQIDRLIADLDSEQFDKREKASHELEKLGALAEPALRKARDKAPSLEMRRRINALLEVLKKGEVSSQQRLAARVMEVLEYVATPEARQFLRELAGGSSGPWCANEAKAVLTRLDRRNPTSGPRRRSLPYQPAIRQRAG